MSNSPAQDDDDDMSATFRVMKEASQEKRRSNLESSTKLLRERGITFDVYNYGVHLVIRSGSRVFDFWPSTGKWIERVSKVDGRGVFNLLKQLEAAK